MANPSKDKGTWVESQVVTYLRANGWRQAERSALCGAGDVGDITGCPGLCWECKWVGTGGPKLGPWMRETQTERLNRMVNFGVLVMKPQGLGAKNVGSWWACMHAYQVVELMSLATVYPSQMHNLRLSGAKIAPGLVGALTILDDLVRTSAGAEPSFSFVEIPPVGVEDPRLWYMVTRLDYLVPLLAQAGYGGTDANFGS